MQTQETQKLIKKEFRLLPFLCDSITFDCLHLPTWNFERTLRPVRRRTWRRKNLKIFNSWKVIMKKLFHCHRMKKRHKKPPKLKFEFFRVEFITWTLPSITGSKPNLVYRKILKTVGSLTLHPKTEMSQFSKNRNHIHK